MFSHFFLRIKKQGMTKFLLALLIGLFIVLQLTIISSIAQTNNPPLYGKMEKLICGKDLNIAEIEDQCLLLFEAIDGSPKYGILYNQVDFYFKIQDIVNKWGYIDRNYFQLLKSSRLLYQLQAYDDSYFYVKSKDNGYNSIVLVDSVSGLY